MSKISHQNPPADPATMQLTLDATNALGFIWALSMLNSFDDHTIVVIRDSKVNQALTDTGVFYQTDLSPILGSNVNMQILLTHESLQNISRMTISGKVLITHESDKYVFNTGHEIGSLQADDRVEDYPRCPVFEQEDIVGLPVTIGNTTGIKNYVRNSSLVMLLCYENHLEQVFLPGGDKMPYTIKAASSGSLQGKEPNLVLMCEDFLQISDRGVKLIITKKDDDYWLVTETKLNLKDKDGTVLYQKLSVIGGSE